MHDPGHVKVHEADWMQYVLLVKNGVVMLRLMVLSNVMMGIVLHEMVVVVVV